MKNTIVNVDMEKNRKVNLHYLLWTGGWDSTYRLLELLLIEGKRVQPVYVIDSDRGSVAFELRAMQKIKIDLHDNHPAARKLLLPTMFIELNDIKSNTAITEAYNRLLLRQPALGTQNEWLARLTYQYNLSDLEMAVQKSPGPMFSALIKVLEKKDSNGQSKLKVKEELKGLDEYIFFKNFSFPLTEITKMEMLEKSKKEGFFNLMNQTWFCHHPLRSGKPCGVCVPCISVMKEGMGFRMTWYGRIRYHFRLFLSKDQFQKAYPETHKVMRKIKKNLMSKK